MMAKAREYVCRLENTYADEPVALGILGGNVYVSGLDRSSIRNTSAGGLNLVLAGLIGTGLIRNTSTGWLDGEYDSDVIVIAGLMAGDVNRWPERQPQH
jgi:hypothetical protein